MLTIVLLLGLAPVRSALAAGRQSDPALPTRVARGFQAYDVGRYEAARIHFERALQQGRLVRQAAAEAEAQRGLGMTLHKLGKYADASRAGAELSPCLLNPRPRAERTDRWFVAQCLSSRF